VAVPSNVLRHITIGLNASFQLVARQESKTADEAQTLLR
jgi:hypothetical protein